MQEEKLTLHLSDNAKLCVRLYDSSVYIFWIKLSLIGSKFQTLVMNTQICMDLYPLALILWA